MIDLRTTTEKRRTRIQVDETRGGGLYVVRVGYGTSPVVITGLTYDQMERVCEAVEAACDSSVQRVQREIKSALGLSE